MVDLTDREFLLSTGQPAAGDCLPVKHRHRCRIPNAVFGACDKFHKAVKMPSTFNGTGLVGTKLRIYLSAIKNYDVDAFWRDGDVRKALIIWTILWPVLGSVILSGGLSLPVELSPVMKLNIASWCASATFLFWFTGIIGCYFIYPLLQKSAQS